MRVVNNPTNPPEQMLVGGTDSNRCVCKNGALYGHRSSLYAVYCAGKARRAYLIDGPFADVAEPIVSTSRLSFVMAPPSDITVESFGADVAGIHDLDGDDVPDIRVAATVVSASGGSESLSLVYQSITGALIGIGRRAGNLRPLETARGDTDLNVAVDTRVTGSLS